MADRFGYGEIGLDIHTCRGCEDYDESDGCKSNGGCGKPITNADKIRAMSDEELAIWMAQRSICTWCPAKNINTASPCKGLYSGCKGNWLYWLRQEQEVE